MPRAKPGTGPRTGPRTKPQTGPRAKPGTRPPAALPRRTRLLLSAAAGLLLLAVAAWYLSGREASQNAAPSDSAAPTAASSAEAGAPLSRHLYSETADPKADIARALAQARREHKRVLVDFGGDWCGDCQVLDLYLHQPPNAQLLAANYLLVHVWIGHIDANLDIPTGYGIPISKGVPALAVLDPAAGVVYAQRSGEFEKMRQMDPATVTEFLEKWKS
ncbi:MAG: thioredoxin family protein [Acidobacteriota bacterium]|nr:thioredoxin family protein [Acidobacteriota bacterium]